MSKLKKALEKARQSREDFPGLEDEAISLAREEASTSSWKGQEIDPTYVQTKIQHIDFSKLEERKIISIHHCNQVSDRFKLIRTQVLSLLRERERNSILITSANRNEGRTTTAINLAISMAQQLDSTVLLVDADLKAPSIHKILGLSVEKGLVDCLLGQASIEESLINPGISRLVILPSGRHILNTSEILAAPRAESIFRELKDRYSDRFIIIDSPPLLTGADALILTGHADAVLLVVEAERTTKDDLLRMRELLGGKPVVGSILTKFRP